MFRAVTRGARPATGICREPRVQGTLESVCCNWGGSTWDSTKHQVSRRGPVCCQPHSQPPSGIWTVLGNLPLAFRTPVPFHFLTLKEVNADVIGNVRRTCHQLHEHLRLKKRINTSSTKRYPQRWPASGQGKPATRGARVSAGAAEERPEWGKDAQGQTPGRDDAGGSVRWDLAVTRAGALHTPWVRSRQEESQVTPEWPQGSTFCMKTAVCLTLSFTDFWEGELCALQSW